MDTASNDAGRPQKTSVKLALTILLIAPCLSGQAVYVPNFTTSNISGYIVDPATGALAPIPGLPLKTGTSPIQTLIHPSGKFLYVLSSGSQDITLYSITAPSGALSVLPCPNCDAATPSGMAIDPAGQYLFVTNLDSGGVTSYSINPWNGSLTKGVVASTGLNSRPLLPVVDPTGRYLYVADSNTGQVSGFQISGPFLTSVPGSPFAAGSGPSSVATSRTNLYIANRNSGDLSVYQIAPGGTLAPLGLPVPTGGNPTSVAVDPSGTFVYVANQLDVIAFNTTPSGVYPLTFLRAYHAGSIPSYIAVDQDARFVYVVNTESNDVSGFSISAGGTLIPAGSASIFGVSGPRMLAVHHIGDTTAFSLTAGYPSPPAASYGIPVTIRGALRNTLNPGLPPGGSVTVTLNGYAVGSGAVGLDASGAFGLVFDASTLYLPPGTNLIQLTYNPAIGFEAPAPLRITYTVSKATPSISVLPPADPIAGQSILIGVTAVQAAGRYPSGFVTFSIDGFPAGAPVPLVNGAASLSWVFSGGDHSISLQYSGDGYFAAANAGPFIIHPKYKTSTIVRSDSTVFEYGYSPVLTATVTGIVPVGGGSVDFFEDGAKINSTPVIVSAGQAQFGPYPIRAGVRTITAQYSGDSNSLPSSSSAAPLVLTVNRAAVPVSTPQLSGNAVYGPLRFSASVTPVPGTTGFPGGTIALREGATVVQIAPLTNGVAVFSVTSLGAGPHSLTASYSGDSNHQPADSVPTTILIAKAAPDLTLTSASGTLLVSGQAVNLTASISSAAPVQGSVDFYDSGVRIPGGPAPVVNGQARFTYTVNKAGTHAISAVYSGDANCESANNAANPLVLTVRQASTTLGALSKSGSAIYGQPLMFAVAVSAVSPGSGIPTGVVAFRDDAQLLGEVPVVAGAASLTTSALRVGSHSISAAYLGDADFAASASAMLSLIVDKAATTTALTYSRGPASTVLIARVSSGGTVPGGWVQFANGGKPLGTAALVPETGSATATLAIDSASGPITAAYTGNENFLASTSATVNIVPFAKAATSLSVKAFPGPASAGQPVACTVDLSWSGDIPPGGTVQLFDNGNQIGTAPAAAHVVFSAAFPAGSHELLAAYSGDMAFLSSTARYALLVNRGAAAIALSAAPPETVFGQTIAVSATLVPAAGAVTLPAGRVDFLEGARILGSAPLRNGAAAGTLPPLEPGPHQITAVYPGDDNWNSIASSPISITVAKAATTVEIVAAPAASGTGGIALTATLRVLAPGAGTPSGTVEFVEALTNQVLASAPVTGEGATAALPEATGAKTVVAVYRGDARLLESSSASTTQFAVSNAASYGHAALAPDQIASVFAPELAAETLSADSVALPPTLGGVCVTITDSAGSVRQALLFYVSPGQISFLVPAGTAVGPATLRIVTPGGASISAAIAIAPVFPGLFAANSSGEGVAAAQVVRVHPDGTQEAPANTAAYDAPTQTWITNPVLPRAPGDELYLVLYATGIRNRTSEVIVNLNGQDLPALYAGAQPDYPGLDQVNVRIPPDLQQPGTAKVAIAVDGAVSNTVTLEFQ